MTHIMFDYIKEDKKPVSMRLTLEGTMMDTVVAISRLIQKLWTETDPFARDVLKKTIQAAVSDDSPIWEPMDCVTINLKELARQTEEMDK